LDELKHYGVLGMKWGVRKDYRGLSNGRKREDYITNGGRVKKGQMVKRVSTDKDELNEGSTFVRRNTSTEVDNKWSNDFYKTELPMIQGKESYTFDLRLKEDLILPSMREKGKAFVEEFLKNDDNRSKLLNVVQKSNETNFEYFANLLDAASKETKFDISNKSFKTSIDDFNGNIGEAFREFQIHLNNKGIRDIYVLNLQKKGYNASSDDNDDMHVTKRKFKSRDFIPTKKVTKIIDGVKKRVDEHEDFYELNTGSMIIFDRKKSLEFVKVRKN
jgi:hypothetical protein